MGGLPQSPPSFPPLLARLASFLVAAHSVDVDAHPAAFVRDVCAGTVGVVEQCRQGPGSRQRDGDGVRNSTVDEGPTMTIQRQSLLDYILQRNGAHTQRRRSEAAGQPADEVSRRKVGQTGFGKDFCLARSVGFRPYVDQEGDAFLVPRDW